MVELSCGGGKMIVETPERPKTRSHSMPEGRIQAECYQYFWEHYPQYRGLYFAVPNENTRADSNAISGAIRRSMGVYHGVSDTIFLLPRGGYHALLIEYKDEKGRQSAHQVAWQKLVESQNYLYKICRSLEQFKIIIKDYLNGINDSDAPKGR